MSKKLGLALGAGGARGVAHIGFLQALEEMKIKPDFVSGCSMGAIVGACYCAGVSPNKMKQTVLGFKLGLADLAVLNVSPLHHSGFMRLTKARKIMEELMGDKTFNQLKIPFTCVATDLVKGELVLFDQGKVIDSALASASIPGAFTPAEVGPYKMLVDGCVLERVPVKEVKKMGADVVVAVDVLGDLPEAKEASGKFINTILRVIDIMETRNAMSKRRGNMRYVDLWLEPELGAISQYLVKNLDVIYQKGYELGLKYRNEIKDLIS